MNTTTTGDQYPFWWSLRTVAVQPDGSFIGAWIDASAADGSGKGIYLQRFDINGTKLGMETLVNTTTSGDQDSPSIAVAPDGSFVIAWQGPGTSLDVFAQRFSASGVRVGNEFLLNQSVIGNQKFPEIVFKPDRSLVAAFLDNAATTLQRFDSNLRRVGLPTSISSAGGAVVLDSMDVRPDGSILVTWTESGHVYFQLFDATLAPLTAAALVSNTTAGAQQFSLGRSDGQGNMVIAWESDGQDGSGNGVYARRFNSSGTPLGAGFVVSATTANNQRGANVLMHPSGNFVVVWGDDNNLDGGGTAGNSTGYSIQMRLFDVNGNRVGTGDTQVNQTATGIQDWCVGTINGNGDFVIGWEGNGNQSGQVDTYGAFARRFKLNQTGTTTMSVTPTARSTGDLVTVIMSLTAPASIANVSPVPLTVSGTNGVFATLVSGPSPASASVGGSPVNFTWTYRITAQGASGQLTFGGNADDNGANIFPYAISNTVKVTPGLYLSDMTAPNLVGDSNVSAQPDQGPHVFTIGAKVSNPTTNTLTDVMVYLGDGSVPGAFPSTTMTLGQTHNTYQGSFSLSPMAGGGDVTRPLATLGAAKNVIAGGVDFNGDGLINASDNGTLSNGRKVIAGRVDVNLDNVINSNDDYSLPGVYFGYREPFIIDGSVDINGDGVITTADAGTYGGETRNIYWQVSYDVLDAAGQPTWGDPSEIFDDLRYNWTVWGTGNDAGVTRSASYEDAANVRNEISANANKVSPNPSGFISGGPPRIIGGEVDINSDGTITYTDDGVYYGKTVIDGRLDMNNSGTITTADDGVLLGFTVIDGRIDTSGGGTIESEDNAIIVVPGQTFTITVHNATFGTVGAGFDENRDNFFDYDFWHQPVGKSTWDSGAFRLVDIQSDLTGVGGNNPLNGIITHFDNEPYLSRLFQGETQSGGFHGTYSYTFVVLGQGSGLLTPYQEAASGTNNEKYNGDFGTAVQVLTGSGAVALAISKVGAPDPTLVGGATTWTITYQNTSTTPVGDPGSGNVIVIEDAIPANTTFVPDSTTSTGFPTIVQYSIDGGITWTTSPPPASSVNRIRWTINQTVPVGGNGTVSFQAAINSGTANFTQVANTAEIRLGTGPILGTATDQICVGACSPATISGRVSKDTDNNNAGVTLFAEVTLTLYTDPNGDGDPSDGVIFNQSPAVGTVITGPGGTYSFTGLLPGNYVVVETDPAGYISVGDTDSTVDAVGSPADATNTNANNNRLAVNLAEGETDSGNDFVDEQTAVITGSVLRDTNGDNVGDTGIGGVTVTLFTDPNGDGNPADGAAYGSPATTLSDGSYSFGNLSPGSYVVVESQPAGYLDFNDGDATADTPSLPADAANTSTTDNCIPVNVAAGETDNGNNFVERGNCSIGDFIWNDANGNGNQDPGEIPLTNVVVFIDRDGNGLRDANEPSATTNGFEIYSLSGLVSGTCTVAVDTTTTPAGASQTGDPDGTFNNQTTVTLSAGEHEDTVDFGYQSPLFSISGQVRNDTDVDGDLADSENGLAAVAIKLYTDPDGDGDPADGILLAVTYTDGSGNYCFHGLPDGNYAIVETNPSGAISTADAVGANDDQIAVTIAASNVTGRDFLDAIAPENLHLISGTVYDDGPFNDDSFSADDNPIAAVTVSLYADVNANGVLDPGIDILIQPSVTSLLGGFRFDALPDGAYFVVETDPAGATSESDTEGSLTDNLIAVTLAGTDSFANDFLDDNALVLYISGQVRNDTDGDGDPSDSDTGINGVKVTIYTDPNGDGNPEDGAELGFTVTAFDGSYQFNNLPPGNYVVNETDPVGASSTYDVAGSPLDNSIPVSLSVTPAINQDFLDDAPVLACISGHVFDDGIPNDNDFGPGDSPISAVKLFLYADLNDDGTADQNDRIIDVALTDALGYYHFDQLPNGSYVVSEVDPIDGSSENDAQGSPFDNEIAVALTGAHVTDRDFLDDGLILHGVSGQVRDDFDADGELTDADLPVGGVVVSLFADTNGDGTAGPNELVTSTTTGNDGRYVFANLPDGSYLVVETDPAGATSTADVSGSLTDNLITVNLADADSTGNDFLDAVDPSGCIYASATGQIIPGGTVQLTGPGAVNILMDGTTGQYSFLTDGTAGTYILSYTPPAGYLIDPTRPEAGPFFDPSGGPDPTVLGSSEDSGNPGYLVDYSSGTNAYYFTFELAPGDPLVINNNIPLVEIKPTNWAEWKYQNELGGNNGPTQNADGDSYDNLQEYAFCLPGNNGLNAHCPLEVIVNGASIDANITTVTGITDAAYTLEYIADLRNSSANGGGWTPVTTIIPTSVDNPDGTSTVTYADLESLPGLASGHGFVRVIVELASPATTTRTYAAGWQDRAITQNGETFSNPFLKCEIFSGAVTGNTSSVIDLSGSIPLGSIRAQLMNGRTYYAEVTAGPLVGNRWWIVNASSTATTIAVSTGTTALTANALVGSSLVVREAHTFAEMFPPADFHAGNSLVTADKILVYDPSTPSKWVNYFLADLSGVGLGIHWVRSTDPITNRDATPLDACQGIFIHHRAATVYTTQVGQVRENQIACPLKPGYNLVGGGYPVIQTPYDRAMTWDGSTFNGFAGSIDSARSDTLLFWKGDYTLGAENYINYWLVDAGFDPYRRWALQEDNSVLSQDTTDLFGITRAAFYETETGNPGYIMPTGWTP